MQSATEPAIRSRYVPTITSITATKNTESALMGSSDVRARQYAVMSEETPATAKNIFDLGGFSPADVLLMSSIGFET